MGGEPVGRVLVVCEVQARAHSLAWALSREGYATESTNAVESGCACLREAPFDAVVVELGSELSVLSLLRSAAVAIPPVRGVCLLPHAAMSARAEWSAVREVAFACLPHSVDGAGVLASVRSAQDAHRTHISIGRTPGTRPGPVSAGPPVGGRG